MTTLGTGLISFSMCALALLFIVQPFLKINKYSYVVYLFVSIFWIIYYIAARWGQDIHTLVAAGGIQTLKHEYNSWNPYYYSFTVSKVLLLDMCPFMALILPFTIIFDYKFKYAKNVAVFAFFGGFITILGGMYNQQLQPNETLAHFIFIGTGLNRIYFLMHFYLMMMGASILLIDMRFNLRDLLYVHIIGIGYMLYVLTISRTLDIVNNVTGLAYGDWLGVDHHLAEYGVVYDVFYNWNHNLTWYDVMWISYFLVWCAIMLIILFKNILTKKDQNRIKFWSFKRIYLPPKNPYNFWTYKLKKSIEKRKEQVAKRF